MLADAHVRLLTSRKPDVWLLQGLRTARSFFNDSACPLEGRKERKESIDALLGERMSADVIRNGLMDKQSRWVALEMIDQDRLTDLLPDVETLAVEESEYHTLTVLGSHGDERQLQLRECPECLSDLIRNVVRV